MDESGKDWVKQEEAKGIASGQDLEAPVEAQWRALGQMVVPLFDVETKKTKNEFVLYISLVWGRGEDEKLN